MKIKSYKDLQVWQKSVRLATDVYVVSKKFPKAEIYGLTSQMRRAAFAIPSNIAEGHARAHLREYIQFLSIAYGSAAELETQLLIASEIKIITQSDFSRLTVNLNEIQKMLNSLISRLKKPKT